jgi:RNA polymerase II subunit A small phosphatase-like protein
VESRDPTYAVDEKTQPIVNADQSQSKDEEQDSHAPADTQGEGTSTAVAQSEPTPVGTKEQESTTAAPNGVITEVKTNGVHPHDEPAAGDEVLPANESIDKKAPVGEGEDSTHEEDVQPTTVLPPPPPLPVPEAPIAPDAGEQQWLLPPPVPHLQNRKCLVLDLDETLVHSSFKVRMSISVRKLFP